MYKLTRPSVLLTLLAAAGCVNTSGNTNVACEALAPATPDPPPAWGGTVFTIVMENKSRSDIVGNRQAPFINDLMSKNTLAAGYHDSFVHPSEPNYLWMVAGENFNVIDDDDPGSHHLDSTSHLADQIENAGLTWKTYQESMGDPCGLTSHGRYAAKHNPFVYFNDINGWDGTTFQPSERCTTHVVDYAQFDVDLANHALPKYVFITPDLDHEMHDGSIAEGDAWLHNEIGKIVATDAFKNGGVIFLLWDEGGGLVTGDDPPFIAVSPNAKPGFVSDVDYDTSSYLKTVQNILGVAELPCVAASDRANVSAMHDLFTVPLTKTP